MALATPPPPTRAGGLQPYHDATGRDDSLPAAAIARLGAVTPEDVSKWAMRIRNKLTRLGVCYRTKDGRLREIVYKNVDLVCDEQGPAYATFEVDPERIPHGRSIDQLHTPRVLNDLSAVVGLRVEHLNSVGLTYIVRLRPKPRPRPLPERVPLPEITPDGQYMIPFGVSAAGDHVWASLLQTLHILIGGDTGSGKTEFIHAIVMALLRVYAPARLRLLLIDPKKHGLSRYTDIPHLARPVATDPRQAASSIGWLFDEVERREAVFGIADSLEEYNQGVPGVEQLPLILAVIDEIGDLALAWQRGDVPARDEDPLAADPATKVMRLAQKARSVGVILVFATQHPKSVVLDTLVTNNCKTRVAFRCETAIHSTLIVRAKGAERLRAPGRMLTNVGMGGGALQVLQGYLVDKAAAVQNLAQMRSGPVVMLDELDRDIVDYIVTKMDGVARFRRSKSASPSVPDLYDPFVATGRMSEHALRDKLIVWQQRGWLHQPGNMVATPRRITVELLRIAGFDLRATARRFLVAGVGVELPAMRQLIEAIGLDPRLSAQELIGLIEP